MPQILEQPQFAPAGLNGQQIEKPGEIKVREQGVRDGKARELGKGRPVGGDPVRSKLKKLRAFVAEHDHVVEVVVVHISDETTRVVGAGEVGEGLAAGLELA